LITAAVIKSFEIVGNVVFLIVNVTRTLSTRGRHEIIKSRSSFLKYFVYGILENSAELFVTFEAHSIAIFKQIKQNDPIPNGTHIIGPPLERRNRTERSRPNITRNSAPIMNAGIKNLKESIAQAWSTCEER